jgi:diguanylate cyclase (GGDEF)-like protein/PAS domain S-box-containing protein
VLLVFFFGLQQRSQKQTYYRFWFVGWIFVLFSYSMWALETDTRFHVAPVLELLRSDFLILAALTFLTSFLSANKELARVVIVGLPVALPVVAAINLQNALPHSVPRPLMALLVLAWESYGLYAANVLLPRSWKNRRLLVFLLCLFCSIAIPAYLYVSGTANLAQCALAEILFSAAILYGVDHTRRTLASVIGSLGYFCWGAFYLLAEWFQAKPIPTHLLSSVWNLPKYFVAFSMILKIFEDFSDEQLRQASAFRLMYEEFRLLYDNHFHPLWICDPATGRFLSANQAAIHDFGYTEHELRQMTRDQIEVPRDEAFDEVNHLVPPVAEGERNMFRHKDGSTRWVKVTTREIFYQGTEALLVMARDIGQQLQLNYDLAQQARRDALTGLPNLLVLQDRLERALARSIRDDKKLALLSIDIDHFKRINDTHGHPVGDACLKAVADRLKSKIRSIDTLARVGGEEFIAIIGSIQHVADVEVIANSLLHLFAQPVQLPECELPVTISIGVAIFPNDADTAETLRQRSDAALYAAKRAGRNRVAYARLQPATPPSATELLAP